MADCLFCKIAAGEVPSDVVASDDRYVAFRDIAAQAPTHIVIIPRTHVASLNEVVDPNLIGGLMLFAKGAAKQEGLAERGYRVVLNTNADGGQTIFHIHAHVLGGRILGWPPG
jgi:histidine triad (HIT) family protein